MTNLPFGQSPSNTKESSLRLVINTCLNCKTSYSVEKSTSSLRLTYCNIFCETHDLGFSMDALEKGELSKKSDLLKRKLELVQKKSDPLESVSEPPDMRIIREDNGDDDNGLVPA